MRVLLAIAWLFVGLGALIYHFGPGAKQMELDQVDSILAQARKNFQEKNYVVALDKFDEALAKMPSERVKDSLAIRLEKAKLQMISRQLPEARNALEGLLEETESCDAADDNLKCEVRLALATAQYYTTWLLRLEGEPKDVWETEIESARQNYRMLLEKAEADSDNDAVASRKEDLEAAIRLARLDLTELQGLPLPSQCKGCCSCQCKGKKPGKKKKPEGKGAGFGKPDDQSGS